ncbi:MAG: right-handed parallel beta-helix repeat-containing protein [Saprospiraceae bacterium]
MKRRLLYAFNCLFLIAFLSACHTSLNIPLEAGMTITHSLAVDSAIYIIPGADSLQTPVLLVQGDNIVLDFKGATLDSGMAPSQSNRFTGLGLLVKGGSKITIKNLKIKGYKVALMAEDVDSLQIINCDFSYNYRPKLFSLWDREDFSDWLSYHQNDGDEWLRYGAGVYLKNCQHAVVKEVKVSQGQNGILMTNCNDGLLYNNSIQYNSGLGIGMYRSSRNRIMHNRLDWNVRGYSHGKYQRGQDSAGILCYEQSHENIFAYNSATHSGDGFFLWAGQTTMDTGAGGCNDNLIYANDFSQAPTNGIEVTFSRNLLINNFLEECRYGVWGGYSWGSKIIGNQISNCDIGIAIEHGQDNFIERNRFHQLKTGIQLWERTNQPTDWGYAQARNVRSRDYVVQANLFSQVAKPLEIASTDTVAIAENIFIDYETLLTSKTPNDHFSLAKNQVYNGKSWGAAQDFKVANEVLDDLSVDTNHVLLGGYGYMPPPLLDGIDAILPENHPRGRKYILMNEWGPYNFQYPSVWLREINEEEYLFLLMGPAGNWKAINGEGFLSINPKTGTFPATFKARKSPGSERLLIQFEFIGEAFTDQFGQNIARGNIYPFSFQRFEKRIDWQVSWHAYDEATDPVAAYEAFRGLRQQRPLAKSTGEGLVYHWWGSPAEGVPVDQFATFAEANPELEQGQYLISISSDDGLRFYVDGKLVLDHWAPHEPAMQEVTLSLGGKHHFLVEHYEKSGLSAIDFRIKPVSE